MASPPAFRPSPAALVRKELRATKETSVGWSWCYRLRIKACGAGEDSADDHLAIVDLHLRKLQLGRLVRVPRCANAIGSDSIVKPAEQDGQRKELPRPPGGRIKNRNVTFAGFGLSPVRKSAPFFRFSGLAAIISGGQSESCCGEYWVPGYAGRQAGDGTARTESR